MKHVASTEAPAAVGPYSHAILSNCLVFASGQIPLSPEIGTLAVGDIKEQAEQAIRNLKAVLTAAGSSLDHVVKTTCFLTDIDDFDDFNEVYAKHFTGRPARSCVAVSDLPKGAMIEIEAIAEII